MVRSSAYLEGDRRLARESPEMFPVGSLDSSAHFTALSHDNNRAAALATDTKVKLTLGLSIYDLSQNEVLGRLGFVSRTECIR
jgi:hypothetical protein